MRKAFLCIFLMLVCHSLVSAQISRPGTPPGITNQQSKTKIPVVELPPIDLDRLHAEDQVVDTISSIPWRFGENISVSLHPQNSGTWHTFDNGDRLWQLGISSPGAFSLNLIFDQYLLPPGAELYLYNSDRSAVMGAFTARNNQTDLHFATSPLPGDAMIIEYFEPAGVAFSGLLTIHTVTHAYRDIFGRSKAFGSSGSCNLNVACEEALPWQDQVNAAVMIIIDGNKACSGVLVNNTLFDATPYLLSANHCFGDASSLVVIYNWQSETCANPAQSPPTNTMSGAVTRARHPTSDFWLLELNQAIPDTYQPFFAGWNRTLTDSLTGNIFGIHHPRADIKKFSYALDGVQSAAYIGGPFSGTTHWRIVWDGGTTTEPGSSGSAIFDAMGRVIGQLHGGYAACGNTLPDWYGRFGVSWDGGGSAEARLSDWLDPLGRNTTALGGFDPQKLQSLPESDTSLEEITLTDGSAGCFEALFTITTGGSGGPFITQPGASARLVAGESIRMLSGTHLQHGSQVEAWIAPGGPFCEEPDKQMVEAEAKAEDEAEQSEVPGDSEGFPDKAEIEFEIESGKFFSVYPNPTPGRLTLEIHTADQTGRTLVEVYGLRGERVLREELPGDLSQHILSIEGQLPGLYIARVVSGQDVGVERIIKR